MVYGCQRGGQFVDYLQIKLAINLYLTSFGVEKPRHNASIEWVIKMVANAMKFGFLAESRSQIRY